MGRKFERVKQWNWLFLLGAVAVILLYGWRVRYGMAFADEAFYLTVPWRLTQGDTLLVDEWHVSQLVGFLIWPLMALYRLLFQDTTGMVLRFRILWLLLHIMVMMASYVLLRGEGRRTATAAALIYGFFSAYGIMALSYNSIGLGTMYLLTVLLVTRRDRPVEDVVKGLLLAAMVLCNPYCLVLYGVLLAAAVCNHWKRFEAQLDVRHILWIHLGIGLLLVPFLIHLALGVDSVGQLMQCLGYILQDPAHPDKPFLLTTFNCIQSIVQSYPLFFLCYVMLVAIGMAKRTYKNGCLGAICLLCSVQTMVEGIYYNTTRGMNSVMFFFQFVGIAAFLFQEKKDWGRFAIGIGLPFLHGLMMNMSSNQGFYVVSDSSTVASAMGTVFLSQYLREQGVSLVHWKGWRGIPCLMALAIAVQLGTEIHVERTHIFWEQSLLEVELNAVVEDGPLAGLYTTEEHKQDYEELYQALSLLGDVSEKQVMFFRTVPVGYLAVGCRMAAPSGWMEYSDLTDERLEAYFEINPDKRPDCIFIDRTTIGDWTDQQLEEYADTHGYIITVNTERCVIMEA